MQFEWKWGIKIDNGTKKKWVFLFIFIFFSLKFLYIDLKYYFIYILVIKFVSGERGSLENNKRENNQLPNVLYFFSLENIVNVL